jgi:predicted 3-demethylubiquinone-9 3-methyltransferase (glyoxalase superfamily)
MDLTVDFTVAGQQLQGLDGGQEFRFNESVSFVIDCEDQAEVDRPWESLRANGGEPGPCGWLKDRPVRNAVSHHTGRQIH